MNTLHNMKRYKGSGDISNVNCLFRYRNAMGDNKQKEEKG